MPVACFRPEVCVNSAQAGAPVPVWSNRRNSKRVALGSSVSAVPICGACAATAIGLATIVIVFATPVSVEGRGRCEDHPPPRGRGGARVLRYLGLGRSTDRRRIAVGRAGLEAARTGTLEILMSPIDALDDQNERPATATAQMHSARSTLPQPTG
jgi:hypothetical protein